MKRLVLLLVVTSAVLAQSAPETRSAAPAVRETCTFAFDAVDKRLTTDVTGRGLLEGDAYSHFEAWLEARLARIYRHGLTSAAIEATRTERMRVFEPIGSGDRPPGFHPGSGVATTSLSLSAAGDAESVGRLKLLFEERRSARNRRVRIRALAVAHDAADAGVDRAVRRTVPLAEFDGERARASALPGAETLLDVERESAFGDVATHDRRKPLVYVEGYERRTTAHGPVVVPVFGSADEGVLFEIAAHPGEGGADGPLLVTPRFEAAVVLTPLNASEIALDGEKRPVWSADRNALSWKPGVVELPREGGVLVADLYVFKPTSERRPLRLLVCVAEEVAATEAVSRVEATAGGAAFVDWKGAKPPRHTLTLWRGDGRIGTVRVVAGHGGALLVATLEGETPRVGDVVRD
ncbi:MAG TPA: hypothetical protein VEI02_16480 [Planctomycetota bacterium]|nr:hypothetical protein [Planctomycetota bacterium]